MKNKFLIPFLLVIISANSFAASPLPTLSIYDDYEYFSKSSSVNRGKLEAFLKMTPKEFKKLTGHKLTVKEIIKLKLAQNKAKALLKSGNEDKMPKVAYVILVIFGFGFIPIGILSDWKGNDWWVNLLLTFLCWLPGVIHGLVIMKKYYP
jgi:uncharacterized membrane protein YqaE (UPF0057 family)